MRSGAEPELVEHLIDQRLWRFDTRADHGPLEGTADRSSGPVSVRGSSCAGA
ncbi:hypothetical protein ACQPZ2_36370 [Nocardia pseudovaccinii]|uniref:hypothetical protein n=1 Tax=Nocardia pseudovaccinii TaxID=189540 RepID=UPI003D8AA182